jgi:hypothetical protein
MREKMKRRKKQKQLVGGREFAVEEVVRKLQTDREPELF